MREASLAPLLGAKEALTERRVYSLVAGREPFSWCVGIFFGKGKIATIRERFQLYSEELDCV